MESSKAQYLAWTGSSNVVCQTFGPGLVLSRHFTAFVVIRPLQLGKAMTILSASKHQSLDDLFELRWQLFFSDRAHKHVKIPDLTMV